MNWLKRFIKGVANLFSKLDSKTKKVLPVAVRVTEAVKKFMDSPYADVTSTTILVTPNLLANGTCTVTERGAVASTSANPTTANIKVSNGSGTGTDIGNTGFTGLINVPTVPVDLDFRMRHDLGTPVNITLKYANINCSMIGL